MDLHIKTLIMEITNNVSKKLDFLKNLNALCRKLGEIAV